MKVLIVHNWYRIRGGEDSVVEKTLHLLKRKRINVTLMDRNSKRVGISLNEKFHAFGSGLYSFSAARDMTCIIRHERPDVVHIHNLYPFFSPSILVACRRASIPVVMTCHNYRFSCPTGIHLRNGNICELCVGGHEYWCVLKNCKDNIFESVAYGLRSLFARRFRFFHDKVVIFIAPTQFAKLRLINDGIAEKRIITLPNSVAIPALVKKQGHGKYIAYVGRIAPEKGVDTLIAAARFTKLPVRLAGECSPMLRFVSDSPPNVNFLGFLKRPELTNLYQNALCLVLPSRCFEVCPLSVLEAMSHSLPVIASNIGGLSEIVEDGVTGFLFEPGNSEDLASKMTLLWENPNLCLQMGHASREKAIHEYGEGVYFRRLIAVYNKAFHKSKDMKT